MKIQMTVGLEGLELSLQAGDIYDTDDAEAIRLIDAGFAIPFADKAIERMVKRRPAETRSAPEAGPVDEAPSPVETQAPAARKAKSKVKTMRDHVNDIGVSVLVGARSKPVA